MVKPVSRSYEFGSIRIDVEDRRLTREGQIIRLTPKAFDLLLLLVENRGRVVEKEIIMESLWRETSVEESNLTQTIYLLRRALGESPDGESYIETIPKIGYRLLAPVPEVEGRGSDVAIALNDGEHEKSGASHIDDGPDAVTPRATGAAIGGASVRIRPVRFSQALVVASGMVCLSAVLVYLWKSRPADRSVEVKSIAVLPFKPIHIDSNDEYLGLGMADALITRLSNLRSITVRPTDSIRRYAGVDRNSVEVGRELGVEEVLAGSIQRLGNRLRVTVQLIHVKDGAALWSDQFDEKFTDVFALEDSISRHITGTLTVKLSADESRLLARHGTENPDAFDLYLKGRYYWGQKTPATIKSGIECFEQAIKLDPSYALAYAGLADSYSVAASGQRPAERFPKARDAASRAIVLDDGLAEAHASIGYILYKFYWDWNNAEQEFKRAIELNPNDSTAHHYYGEYLCLTGRFDQGLSELNRAAELDPLSATIRADIGIALYRARRYTDAVEQLKSIIERDANFWMAHLYLALVYEENGMYDESVAEALNARKLSGQFEDSVPSLRDAYTRGGWNGFLRQYLAVMQQHAIREYVPPYWIAVLYVRLGDKDKALEWLARSLGERDDGPLGLKVDPTYDSIRSDARFQDLLRRVGLSP